VEKAVEVRRQLTDIPMDRKAELHMVEEAGKAAEALRELASTHAESPLLSTFSSSFAEEIRTFTDASKAMPTAQPPPLSRDQSEPLRPDSTALTDQKPASEQPAPEHGYRPVQSRQGMAASDSIGRPEANGWRPNVKEKTPNGGGSGLSSRPPKAEDQPPWLIPAYVAVVVLIVFLLGFLLLNMGNGCSGKGDRNGKDSETKRLEEQLQEAHAEIARLRRELDEAKTADEKRRTLPDTAE
jgi:hypothetical protein